MRVQAVTLYWYVGSSWFHGSGLLVLFQLNIEIETDLEYAHAPLRLPCDSRNVVIRHKNRNDESKSVALLSDRT